MTTSTRMCRGDPWFENLSESPESVSSDTMSGSPLRFARFAISPAATSG